MSRPLPILEGDRFRDERGAIWLIAAVYPGGKLWIYNADRHRGGPSTHATVRQWERLSRDVDYIAGLVAI